MIARLVGQGDEDRLAWFSCSTSVAYEDDVEHWVRGEALEWLTEPDGIDRRLILLLDDAEATVLAVAAHEQDDPSTQRFVNVVAVDVSAQGRGLGRQAFATVIADAAARCPGGVATWLVHPLNARSIRMCESAGAEWTSPREDKPYFRFVLDL